MGGVISGLFGGQSASVDVPAVTTPIMDDSEKEPASAAVRDTEKRRLMARRAGYGTILTSPLGTSGGAGLLGRNGSQG